MYCSLAHIEAFGKPHRLGPVAAFLNENKYNYSSSQCAFFKIVCGILEFLDRATRNCRPHSMLFADLFCYLHGTCLNLGSLEPLYQNVSIDGPHLRAGCTLKHGSGNLTILMSTLLWPPSMLHGHIDKRTFLPNR